MAFESMSIARSQCFEIYQYGGVGFPPPPIGGSMIDKKGTAVSDFSLFVVWVLESGEVSKPRTDSDFAKQLWIFPPTVLRNGRYESLSRLMP